MVRRVGSICFPRGVIEMSALTVLQCPSGTPQHFAHAFIGIRYLPTSVCHFLRTECAVGLSSPQVQRVPAHTATGGFSSNLLPANVRPLRDISAARRRLIFTCPFAKPIPVCFGEQRLIKGIPRMLQRVRFSVSERGCAIT